LRFEITRRHITIFVDDPLREHPASLGADSLRVLPTDEVQTLLESTKRIVASKRPQSQLTLMREGLIKYGYFLTEKQISRLPTTFSDWQIHVMEWFSWFLCHRHETIQLKYRVRNWDNTAIPWLRGLIEEGVLPEGLAFPVARLRQEIGRTRSPRNPSRVRSRFPGRSEKACSLSFAPARV